MESKEKSKMTISPEQIIGIVQALIMLLVLLAELKRISKGR